jgi:methionyl-tRNA formyltransferase
MSPLRVVFIGTADLACPSLEALATNADFKIIGVVTQPDRPKGRELRRQPPPVKATALKLGLPVLQPEKIRHADAVRSLTEWGPDIMVVAAYGQILPATVLNLPPLGCVNVHASLLPRYRGAAPIQWAILNGDSESGVTIMKMDEGLDTGAILTQATTPITDEDNAQTLHDRLAAMGAQLLVVTLRELVNGKIEPQKQPPEGGVYARKILKEDGLLNWQMPARDLWNRVRAFNPWPGALTQVVHEGRPIGLKIWLAQVEKNRSGESGVVMQADASGLLVACGNESLRILELQREGKRRLTVGEFLLGTPLRSGMKFG